MHRYLQRTRANLGLVPRSLRPPPFAVPRWMTADFPLRPVVEGAADLLRQGTVRWGCVVQANSTLFGPGTNDSPAVLAVGLDDASDRDPGALHYAATECGALRELDEAGVAALSSDERRIRDALEDEAEPCMGIPVPDSIDHGVRCALFSVLVYREHLPRPFLARKLVPVVIDERIPQGVLIVPSNFWSTDLQEVWQ